ncbi:MAG TPA: hypothetical protein VGI64_04520 [Streptosporangiaceae bacterium]|jgi:hypothetical protein
MPLSSWRSRGLRRPAGLIAFCVLGGLAAAGCGTIPAPGSAQAPSSLAGRAAATDPPPAVPATRLLCANPAGASRAVVTRTPVLHPILPQNRNLALHAVVTSPAKVHDLARALCALPRMPREPMACPMIISGAVVRIQFSTAGRSYPQVRVQTSGCEQVTGLGPPRTVMRTPGFWLRLAHDTGVLNSPFFPVQRRPCGPISVPGEIRHCQGKMQPFGPGQGGVTG